MVQTALASTSKTSEYTWITLVFETKSAAESPRARCEAVANATAVKIVNR